MKINCTTCGYYQKSDHPDIDDICTRMGGRYEGNGSPAYTVGQYDDGTWLHIREPEEFFCSEHDGLCKKLLKLIRSGALTYNKEVDDE